MEKKHVYIFILKNFITIQIKLVGWGGGYGGLDWLSPSALAFGRVAILL